jgi:hypothetical protein
MVYAALEPQKPIPVISRTVGTSISKDDQRWRVGDDPPTEYTVRHALAAAGVQFDQKMWDGTVAPGHDRTQWGFHGRRSHGVHAVQNVSRETIG